MAERGGWTRVRFRQPTNDFRPVTFPPPGPYWCSGEGDGYWVLVAYVPTDIRPADSHVRAFWPEAEGIDVLEIGVPLTFTDRFPCPDWWDDDSAAAREPRRG